MADEDGDGLRDRLSRQGEEALGKLASDLLENPLINSAITRAFSAREKAVHAQEAAMGALNLPSAADIDRLTRRLRTGRHRGWRASRRRSTACRTASTASARGSSPSTAAPSPASPIALAAVEGQLTKLVDEVGARPRSRSTPRPRRVPREQERLDVDDAAPSPSRSGAASGPPRRRARRARRARRDPSSPRLRAGARCRSARASRRCPRRRARRRRAGRGGRRRANTVAASISIAIAPAARQRAGRPASGS